MTETGRRTFSASCRIDAIACCRNGFASTKRAAARARQTAAVPKDKVTVLTACRVQDEPPCLVARDGLHDVGQMLLDLSLGNAQHLCQLIGRQPGARDRLDDPLTRRPFGRLHRVMVGERTRKSQSTESCCQVGRGNDTSLGQCLAVSQREGDTYTKLDMAAEVWTGRGGLQRGHGD